MKTEIRSGLIKKLKTLSSDEKSLKSESIEKQLKNLLKNQNGYWAGYQNLSDEPAVRWPEVSKKIDWCFPIVENETLQFKIAVRKFQISNLGIKEPQDGEFVPLAQVNGCVIPGVAFDQKGFRLGRGKGFYDRTLAGFNGKKIGVCFEMSFCEQLPQEAHDIQCDRVITENLVYKTGLTEGDSKWS